MLNKNVRRLNTEQMTGSGLPTGLCSCLSAEVRVSCGPRGSLPRGLGCYAEPRQADRGVGEMNGGE